MILKRISKFSIKIFLVILSLVIFPLVGVNLLGIRYLENFLQEQMSDSVADNVSRNQDYINDALLEMAYFSSIFVYDDELRERLADEDASYYDNTVYFDYVLNRLSIESDGSIQNRAMIAVFDRYGRVYSNWGLNYKDYQFVLDEDWVQRSMEGDGHVVWSLFSPSYIDGESKRYISLARSIMSEQTAGEYVATLIVSIDQEYFGEMMMQYAYENDQAYICIDGGQTLFASTGHNVPEKDIQAIYEETRGQRTGRLQKTIGGTEYLICYSTFPPRWTFDGQEMKLFHFTDYTPIQRQIDQVLFGVNAATFLIVILVVFISYIASKWLVAPITALTRQMENYSPNTQITGLDFKRTDEIGRLNQVFYQMGQRIQQLFFRLKEENEIKEKYHYDSLRAQLNPHFLFNTLNTIRWMAIIRNADNIVSSIDAIASILKYSMSREEGLVTVEQEIENIRNYIYIHNLRYTDYVILKIEIDESYLKYRTLKFILQPIVENAIIHGYDKTKTSITIWIRGEEKDGDLYIYVKDNGLGISEETIHQFEQEKEKGTAKGRMTGIGLPNVDSYIRIRFGQQYGIRLDKSEGAGTTVIFRLPVIKEEHPESDGAEGGGDTNEKNNDC